MQKIPTKELFDAYFATLKPETAEHRRKIVDRDEVYEYERKLGKQLIDFTSYEILDMMATFHNDRISTKNVAVSMATRMNTKTLLRNIFEFYSRNYEPIVNPMNDDIMKSNNKIIEYFENKNQRIVYSTKDFNDAVTKVRMVYTEEKAEYCELIMQLFYCGFYTPAEIISFTRNDVDFTNMAVRLKGRVVQLNQRCFNLLCRFSGEVGSVGERENIYLRQYKNSFFRVRVKAETDVDTLPEVEVAKKVTNVMRTMFWNKNVDVKLNSNIIFYLGMYDRIVEEFGEKRTKEIIYSEKDTDSTAIINRYNKIYGLNMAASVIKTRLKNFC